MEPLITVAQLEARLAYSVDAAQATTLIDDASALIRDAAGTDFLDPDTGALVVPAGVVPVVVRVVNRAIENPLGHDSETQGNYTWRNESRDGSAGVHLTSRDVRDVRRAVGKLAAGSVVMEGDLPVEVGRVGAVTVNELTGSL